MDVDEESAQQTTIQKGPNQVIHVRQDSASELEALFNTVMNPNFKSKSLPMKARNLPKSFFEQPDKPRHGPHFHHGHSQSMGGLSVTSTPQINHSRSSSSDSNASHTSSVGLMPNVNNNNGASLAPSALQGGVKGHKPGYTMSPAQRRAINHNPFSNQQVHGGLQVPHQQITHSRSKSSPASLELINVATLQVKASDIPIDMPLPPGWSVAKTPDGQQYYMNHNDRTTTWEDPRIALIKQQRQNQLASLQQQSQTLVTASGITQTCVLNNQPADQRNMSNLPHGWEQASTPQGEVYYINHQTRSTSWVDPRLQQNIQQQHGNNQQNNTQLQQHIMKVNQMDVANNSNRVGSSLPPQQQSMLKHLTQEKEILRKQMLTKSHQPQMSSAGMDPFLGSGASTFHQRDASLDSGVGMGSNYSLPRTPEDYLGNVEDMDTGDVARRMHNTQQVPKMVPGAGQPIHQVHGQQLSNNQRFPDFLDSLPSSNVDFGGAGGQAVNNPAMVPSCGVQNSAALDGSDLVPSLQDPLSQDFDVESMLNHVKTETMENGMIWL